MQKSKMRYIILLVVLLALSVLADEECHCKCCHGDDCTPMHIGTLEVAGCGDCTEAMCAMFRECSSSDAHGTIDASCSGSRVWDVVLTIIAVISALICCVCVALAFLGAVAAGVIFYIKSKQSKDFEELNKHSDQYIKSDME